MSDLGTRIHDARIALGLPTWTIEKAVDMLPGTLERIERGERGVVVAEMAGLSQLLGMSIDEMLFGVKVEIIDTRTPEERSAVAFAEGLVADIEFLEALLV